MASSTNTAEIDEPDVESLTTIFKKNLDSYNQIINNQAPTNSPEVQLAIKKCMQQLEQTTRLVSIAGIFSSNEEIEEVPTNNLQYFLLPALLGSLTLKLTKGDRKEIVDVAEIYFKDFLTRCQDYGLCNYDSSKSDKVATVAPQNQMQDIAASINTRANKIQRFKEQKELKVQLADLKTNMENEHVDEEIKRNYFLTMLKLYIHEALDEISSINMEKPILEHIAELRHDDKPKALPKRPHAPLKPIIITKDELQKAVYGAGYPSLPTMTVQEFYDKRVADGVFPDPNKARDANKPLSLQEAALAGLDINDSDEEDAQNEKLVENDDDENLARLRAKDDYKDEHRRGWGNRMNRS